MSEKKSSLPAPRFEWRLREVWPFPSAAEVERRLEEGIRARWGSAEHQPAADVYVHGSEIWVEVDLPGVSPDEIEARVEAGALHVRASRSLPPPLERARAARLERPRGAMRRLVPLPPVPEMAELDLEFEAGVLRVRIRPGSVR
jgi:HSP20 family molecular chaperone IbpA